MELLNATGMEAGFSLGMEPSGREHLIVVVKGTFAFPETAEAPARLADDQEPLALADTFTGEPGLSAPLYEADFALRKPRCDVVLNGCAYAPGGQPVERLRVGLKVGAMVKTFSVLGERNWEVSGGQVGTGRPAPFEVLPLSYDRAFGGVDRHDPDESKHAAFLPNPVGRGFHQVLEAAFLEGSPLPNTEAEGEPVQAPDQAYRPQSFGSVGRSWTPRSQFAGSYDDSWLEEGFPFLPADFNDAYYQSAPPDQQLDALLGGEDVALLNLTPEGRAAFKVPSLRMPVVFFRHRGGREEREARLDTLVIEPDLRRFQLVWRISLALKRDIFEIAQVLAGEMPRGWWRARTLGKTYYPSLGAMARAEKQKRRADPESETS